MSATAKGHRMHDAVFLRRLFNLFHDPILEVTEIKKNRDLFYLDIMGERERSSSARKSFFFRNGTIVVLKEEEEKVQETGTIDRSVDPIENGSS